VVLTIVAFVFVLSVLIFVHELGHYLAAKRLGIKVTVFSLGFGPRVTGVIRGGTDYRLSAVPLGGYVKMAGENPDEERSGAPDEFLSRSKWQRFQVILMGPIMNLLLAVVLMAAVFMHGADVPAFQDQPPIVGAVETGSPADRGGVRTGDRIVSVGSRQVDTWEQLLVAVGARAGHQVALDLLREGRTMTVRVTPTAQGKFQIGDLGVYPDVHPRVRSVNAGDPADKAGIKPGDVILAVDGRTVTFAYQLSEAIAKRPGVPITLAIRRDGTDRNLEVTPQLRGQIGLIGIGIGDELKAIKPGPLLALRMSVEKNYEFSGLILQTVWGLITRETSPKQLMGPVAIAQLSGEYAAAGWFALFSLMASISLNLGLLNLLPIPILDGGAIFIMLLEGLVRRDFSTRVKEKMLLAGFVLLMLLMVTVVYNDLARIPWIARLMFWR
jgi:regulator of sigma E protease